MALSRTDELSIQQQTTPQGILVIQVTGWLTLKNKGTFEAAIEKAQGSNLVLDFAKLEYMDSAGLGALLKAYVTAQKYGGKVVLAALIRRVRDLLQLTKVEPLFQIYDTVDEATAAIGKAAGA